MSIAITTSPRPRSHPAGLAKVYWNDRARRFASRGAGLAAVCAYGMPWFYNAPIHLLQTLALRRWLRLPPGTTVLEIGCGVGRWSRRLAKQGAVVHGLDLSQTMVAEARRRAREEQVDGRCRFLVSDVCTPGVRGRFDIVFGVTVLQHLLDAEQLQTAVRSIADHLAPGGRAILLESAPTRPIGRCDSAVFVAREERVYLDAFTRAGLRCVAATGVDPAPFKTWFLPFYGSLPRPIALAALAAVTLAGLPIDLLMGRRMARASWHKVFVLANDHAASCDTAQPVARQSQRGLA